VARWEPTAGEDFSTASVREYFRKTSISALPSWPTFFSTRHFLQEFERVRSQILGEIVSDNDDPGHVAMKAFNQLVFHNHPYRWPVNGTEETLSKITLADVQNFYAKEYLPNQVILADRRRYHCGTGNAMLVQDTFRILEEGSDATLGWPRNLPLSIKRPCSSSKRTSPNRPSCWAMAESPGRTLTFTP
jgi:hypothetical protein